MKKFSVDNCNDTVDCSLILVTSGKVTVQLRSRALTVEAPALIIQPVWWNVKLQQPGPGFKAVGIAASPRLKLSTELLFEALVNQVCHLTDRQAGIISDCFDKIERAKCFQPVRYRRQLMKYRIEALEAAISELLSLKARSNGRKPKASATNLHFSKFVEILSMDFKTETSVAYYADRLCISPQHLNRIVSEVTGFSVSSFLRNLGCNGQG